MGKYIYRINTSEGIYIGKWTGNTKDILSKHHFRPIAFIDENGNITKIKDSQGWENKFWLPELNQHGAVRSNFIKRVTTWNQDQMKRILLKSLKDALNNPPANMDKSLVKKMQDFFYSSSENILTENIIWKKLKEAWLLNEDDLIETLSIIWGTKRHVLLNRQFDKLSRVSQDSPNGLDETFIFSKIFVPESISNRQGGKNIISVFMQPFWFTYQVENRKISLSKEILDPVIPLLTDLIEEKTKKHWIKKIDVLIKKSENLPYGMKTLIKKELQQEKRILKNLSSSSIHSRGDLYTHLNNFSLKLKKLLKENFTRIWQNKNTQTTLILTFLKVWYNSLPNINTLQGSNETSAIMTEFRKTYLNNLTSAMEKVFNTYWSNNYYQWKLAQPKPLDLRYSYLTYTWQTKGVLEDSQWNTLMVLSKQNFQTKFPNRTYIMNYWNVIYPEQVSYWLIVKRQDTTFQDFYLPGVKHITNIDEMKYY